ncbi:hypothetical protein Bca4012_057993 [Brassica carinata]
MVMVDHLGDLTVTSASLASSFCKHSKSQLAKGVETNHRYNHGVVNGAGKKVSTVLDHKQPLLRLTHPLSKLLAVRRLSENRKDKASVHHLLRHSSNHLNTTRVSRSGFEEMSHCVTRRRRDVNALDLEKGKLDL